MEDEKAKAVQEVAKFGTRALDSGDKIGTFLSKVFGTVPSDVIGVLGGDWLHHIRIRNVVKLAQRTEEILQQRGILDDTTPMSPSVALPILIAAQDEAREELRELWARMLANGLDPNRRQTMRQSITNTVKNFDPFDAVILHKAIQLSSNDGQSAKIHLPISELNASNDEIELSIMNLEKLECLHKNSFCHNADNSVIIGINITSLGREVLRATSL